MNTNTCSLNKRMKKCDAEHYSRKTTETGERNLNTSAKTRMFYVITCHAKIVLAIRILSRGPVVILVAWPWASHWLWLLHTLYWYRWSLSRMITPRAKLSTHTHCCTLWFRTLIIESYGNVMQAIQKVHVRRTLYEMSAGANFDSDRWQPGITCVCT